jgi:hypothetical protein
MQPTAASQRSKPREPTAGPAKRDRLLRPNISFAQKSSSAQNTNPHTYRWRPAGSFVSSNRKAAHPANRAVLGNGFACDGSRNPKSPQLRKLPQFQPLFGLYLQLHWAVAGVFAENCLSSLTESARCPSAYRIRLPATPI